MFAALMIAPHIARSAAIRLAKSSRLSPTARAPELAMRSEPDHPDQQRPVTAT
jgi:hypothetical protein